MAACIDIEASSIAEIPVGKKKKNIIVSEQTKEFVSTTLKLDPTGKMSLGDLYNLYESACTTKQRRPASTKRIFVKELRALFEEEISDGKLVIRTSGPVQLHGLTLKVSHPLLVQLNQSPNNGAYTSANVTV